MMEAKILLEDGLNSNYIHLARKALHPFNPTMKDKVGREYALSNPIRTLFLLSDETYKAVKEILTEAQWRASKDVECNQELLSDYLIASSRPTSKGFWFPAIPSSDFAKVSELFNLLPPPVKGEIRPDGAYIFINADNLSETASRLESTMPEFEGKDVTPEVFKVVIAHEIGHHYSYSNLSRETYVRLKKQDKGNFISDGLANWFAYQFCTRRERWVLAELAIAQPPCYQYYNVFRQLDAENLLFRLLSETDPIMGKLGGQLTFVVPLVARFVNGMKYQIDWNRQGAKIVAIEKIDSLNPMMRGCLITPRIDQLIGRYPRDGFLVIANEIGGHPDYGKLPENIQIVPKSKFDIQLIADSKGRMSGDDYVKSILTDLKVDSNWLIRLFPPPGA